MANSIDPDQFASEEVQKLTDLDLKLNDLDLHCLQRKAISRFSRTRVK